MEMIILVGLPASGKSSFYRNFFVNTHVRINLDMLNTRKKEHSLIKACLSAKIPIVIDNTNVTRSERKYYINDAQKNKYRIICYYFETSFDLCITRDRKRKVPVGIIAIKSKASQLQKPELKEGYYKIIPVH